MSVKKEDFSILRDFSAHCWQKEFEILIKMEGGGREVPGFSLKLGLKSLVILTALNKPS